MFVCVTWFQGTCSLYWVNFYVRGILGVLQMSWHSHINLFGVFGTSAFLQSAYLMWSAIQEVKTHRNTDNWGELGYARAGYRQSAITLTEVNH